MFKSYKILSFLCLLNACQSSLVPPLLPSGPHKNVEVINAYSLKSDYKFQGSLVGGLSSCVYSADEKVLYALSDDRSERAPARIYKLKLKEDGLAFEFIDIITLKTADKTKFPEGGIDAEALVLVGNSFYLTDEGEQEGEKILRQPSILKFSKSGDWLGQINLPSPYQFTNHLDLGPRDNRTLESLTLFDNRMTLIFEGPFKNQEKVSYDKALTLKTLNFEAENFKDEENYLLSPVGELTSGKNMGKADHGVAELMSLGKDHFLVLERSYLADLNQNFIRIFELVKGEKKLWLDFEEIRSHFPPSEQKLDNIESMCQGPMTSDGKRTMIFISDNNFSPNQRSLFVFLKVK